MTCSRVAIINRGKVVATNTPENLMSDLGGDSSYELEISGEVQLAQQLLQKIPGVNSIEVMLTPERFTHSNHVANRTHLRVLSQPGTELGQDIATVLVQSGFGLYEMRRISATLEDVFLQLTTAEKNLPPTTDTATVNEEEAA